MTAKELNKEIQEMRDFAKEISSSKETALKLLVEAGICTPRGNLRKPYIPIKEKH